MKNIMPCVKVLFCNRIPKSSKSNYYLDPKIMTFGTPKFEPEKIQNKISEQEFHHMRALMINIGGEKLKKAKRIYFIMVAYAVLCFVGWLFQIIFQLIFPSKNLQTSMAVSILVTVLPNMMLQCYWKSSMLKACEEIARLFDRENKRIYTARGINWQTCYTLIFIHIRILDSELESFDGDLKGELEKMITIDKARNIENNSNKEILLKHF